MSAQEILSKLTNEKRYLDLYILFRYFYKIGEPIVTDEFYEKFQKIIFNAGIGLQYKNQSYDDDEIPYALLEEFNLTYMIPGKEEMGSYYEELNSEKSTSIEPIENYRDFFKYVEDKRNYDLIISPKKDGVNIKCLYVKGELKVVLTRGRSSNSFNVTEYGSKIIPKYIKTDKEKVIVYGEVGIDESYVDKVPRKGGGTFKQAKTAGLSILRTGFDDEKWYKYLKFHAFNAEGLDYNTISETLDFLKDNGFDTVPYKVYKPEEIPNNFDDFCKWCKSEMTYFWELSKIKDISTDGLVVDVNLKNIETNKDGIYLDRNKALKFEYWSYVYYKGKVKNLIIEQQAQDASVVIEIEPIKTKDNATATRVTGYNLFRVISLGLKPGSDIYFMRVSNTISVLLLGDKLDKMLKEGE